MIRTHPAHFHVLMTVMVASALGACTSRQLYSAGQQWQANECRKLPASEQPRCRTSNAMSFEDYQREAAAARATQ